MNDFFFFLCAVIVAFLVPGPDMIFLLQTGVTHGRTRAMAATLGLGGARTCHVFFAAVGLAALFRTAPWLFALVRFAGAAYLIWLGVTLLRSRSLIPDPYAATYDGGHRDTGVVIRGFLTNLLNPKPLIFCSVLLPQFVHNGAGPILAQFAVLGATLVVVGFLFDTTFALSGAALGAWVARRPAIQNGQRYGFGTVLIGFGAALMMMRVPS